MQQLLQVRPMVVLLMLVVQDASMVNSYDPSRPVTALHPQHAIPVPRMPQEE